MASSYRIEFSRIGSDTVQLDTPVFCVEIPGSLCANLAPNGPRARLVPVLENTRPPSLRGFDWA